MWLCHVVWPVIGIYQLGTHSCIDIRIHDSGLVLVHVGHETNRLNQLQTIFTIYRPSYLVAQVGIVDYGLVAVAIDSLVCLMVIVIHIGDFYASNGIYHTIHSDIVAWCILGNGITK